MLTSDHARMLAVAPGGYNRCVCRYCRPYNFGLARSARRIEQRLLAREVAEAMDEARHDAYVAKYGESYFDATEDGAVYVFVTAEGTAHANYDLDIEFAPEFR